MKQITFFNTRPKERATDLSISLQKHGINVIDIPLLTLMPKPLSKQEQNHHQAFLAGQYDAVVVVSPTAAKLATQACHGKCLNALSYPPIIAVGQATLRVLKQHFLARHGWHLSAPQHLENNEGMLALPQIQALKPSDKLLIWRGVSGREKLINELINRGVHVDIIEWYERKPHPNAHESYQYWHHHWQAQIHQSADDSCLFPSPYVLISSAAAFEHWQYLVTSQAPSTNLHSQQTIAPLSLFHYLVLGERLAGILEKKHLHYQSITNLTPETILASLLPSM